MSQNSPSPWLEHAIAASKAATPANEVNEVNEVNEKKAGWRIGRRGTSQKTKRNASPERAASGGGVTARSLLLLGFDGGAEKTHVLGGAREGEEERKINEHLADVHHVDDAEIDAQIRQVVGIAEHERHGPARRSSSRTTRTPSCSAPAWRIRFSRSCWRFLSSPPRGKCSAWGPDSWRSALSHSTPRSWAIRR